MTDVHIDAYFERIGFAGSIAPTLETLAQLHALHPAAIPFENLNPLMDMPVRLELRNLEQKLLFDRRGGMCIEHNLLFKALLESLERAGGPTAEELLEQALDCLPAEHLKHWFERLLLDIKANRAGMPDLIQFWPEQRRYRMIEVKGPGDRLQDNQLRWLEFCHEHQMPVAVCYVQWAEQSA